MLSQALIVIKLRNRGTEAYKHSEYGDSIVVERRIGREGGNSYKLKDHTGTPPQLPLMRHFFRKEGCCNHPRRACFHFGTIQHPN
jgi:hypothetical protein